MNTTAPATPADLTADDHARLSHSLLKLALRLARNSDDDLIEELIHEGMAAALATVGRKDPAGRASWLTFASHRARYAMIHFLACHRAGLSAAECNRQRTGRRRGLSYPRTVYGDVLSAAPARDGAGGRASVGRVAALLAVVPVKHRRTLRAYLRVNCNGATLHRRMPNGWNRLKAAFAAARRAAGSLATLDARRKDAGPSDDA